MRKITRLLLAVVALLGVTSAHAQYMPKFSNADGTGTQYVYYIAVQNSTTKTFVTTTANSSGDTTCFGVTDNPGTDTNLAKFTVSQSEDGYYTIQSVDRAAKLIYTVSATHAANSVRSYDESNAEFEANDQWILTEKTENYAKGFAIGPKDNNAAINWNKHTNTLGLWGGTSSASICVFIPANLETANEYLKEVTPEGIGTEIGKISKDYADGLTDYDFSIFAQTSNHLYLPSGYYYFKSLNTDSRPPYLFNDLLHEANAGGTTLQASAAQAANNFIWRITNNGTSISIVNGQGTPLTAGKEGSQKLSTLTFSNFNLTQYNALGGIYFTEAPNASEAGHTLSDGTRYITTWTAGGAGAHDNRWTFESIAVDGKHIYNVSITGAPAGAKAYVSLASTDGSTGEIAQDGGFFITDAALTAENLEAVKITGYTTTLTIDGTTINVVYEPFYTEQLQMAIDEAQNYAAMPEGIGYPKKSNLSALQTAIQNATTALEAASQNDLQTLQAAISTYISDVQMPAAGTYLRIKNYCRDLERDSRDAPKSYPGEGGYVTSSERGGRTFDVRATTHDDAGAIWTLVETEDGGFKLYNKNLKKYVSATNATANSQYLTGVDEEEAGVYDITFSGTIPQFNISYRRAEGVTAHHMLHASGYGLMNWNTTESANGASSWIIEPAEELVVTLNKATEADADSWASIYLPFDVTLPSGVTACVGTADEDRLDFALQEIEGGVPAEHGVILKGTQAGPATLTITPATGSTIGNYTNQLTGTLMKTAMPTEGTLYFLGVAHDEAGLYAPAASLTQIPANKAYLHYPSAPAAGVQGFRFSTGGGVTAIDGAATASPDAGICYDLAGRRVQRPAKGLYIINGRKVLVK